jgi:hypothetical protein
VRIQSRRKMASGNVIGLLMEIGADPSKAESAMARLDAASVASSAKVSSVWTGAMNAITGPAGIALGLFTGLGGAAVTMANKWAAAGNEIFEASEKTGMSAQALSGVMALAKETGHSFEGLSTTFARASRNIAQAADIGKGALISLFSQAELQALRLKPVDEQMQTVLHRIFALTDQGERNRQLQALLGRAWMENVSVLKMLANEGYGPAIEQAKRLSVFFDEKAARQAHEYQMEMRTLAAQISGLALVVGREAVPALERLAGILSAKVETGVGGGIIQLFRDWAAGAFYVQANIATLGGGLGHLEDVIKRITLAIAGGSKERQHMTDELIRMQTMAQGAAAGPEAAGPLGAPAKGGKSAAAQQAQDAEHLATAYGKLVTVLPPATDAMQHFGKAFEPLASGPLSLPQLDKNLSATLGLFQQVPPYTEAAASATKGFVADLKLEKQAFEETAKAAAHSTLAHLAHALAAGESLRKAAKEAVTSIAEQAGVQAIWETAQGLAMLALNFFFPNPRYVASADEHFAAAAMYAAIGGVAAAASAGMGRGGGGGGGGASAREASYGGGGSGRGAETSGRGGAAGPGAAVHIEYYGPVVTDSNSTQQLFDQWSQAVRDGTLDLTSSRASIQGPTTTGRG